MNYIDMKNEIKYEQLKKPAQIIKQGGIVVFPTETVYGIGTNGLNKEAIEKLYKIKQREHNKPISLLVSNIDMIKSLTTEISEQEYKLIEKFFPGPLTIILKKRKIIPDILTSNTNFVGIIMPDDPIAIKLIEYAKVPLATTSANISTHPSETNIQNIMTNFGNTVNYYIDGGTSKIGLGSTVIKIENNKPQILRQGSITKQQIHKCLNIDIWGGMPMPRL